MADYSIEVAIPNQGPAGPQGPPGEFGELEAPQDGIIYGRKDGEWVDMTAPANLQVRRGTAAEVAAITPLQGEPVWATDTKLLYLGDGSTVGGIQVSEFPLDGDAASGATPGKIRAANATNGIGAAFGPPQVLGGARGAASVDLQMSRLLSSQIASGGNSVIIGGQNNTANGLYCAVVGGNSSTAGPGSYGLAFGNNATASGDNSVAFSGIASGSNSIAIGADANASAARSAALQNATADRLGMIAFGASTITNFLGRAQAVQFQMRGRTTDATPTEMLLANSVKLTIPANVILYGTIEVSAIQVTTAAESAFYVRKFGIQNLGGTTTLVGSVTTIGTDHESSAGMDVAITADNTGDFLKVEVTGLAATTLRWMAVVRGVEMAIT